MKDFVITQLYSDHCVKSIQPCTPESMIFILSKVQPNSNTSAKRQTHRFLCLAHIAKKDQAI